MENTVNDFWRMVWDYQSRVIVMLCRMKEDGKVSTRLYNPLGMVKIMGISYSVSSSTDLK